MKDVARLWWPATAKESAGLREGPGRVVRLAIAAMTMDDARPRGGHCGGKEASGEGVVGPDGVDGGDGGTAATMPTFGAAGGSPQEWGPTVLSF